MPKDLSSYYLWFDTEFTSLVLEEAALLQVALVITDHQLKRLAPPEEDLVMAVQLDPSVSISAWSEENLKDLLGQCRGPEASPLKVVDAELASYVERHLGPVPEDESLRPIIAGNSIHGDWFLVRKWLPLFNSKMHYRHLDVSSLKLQWLQHFEGPEFDKGDLDAIRQYFPEVGQGLEAQQHDALYDVLASIAELAYYRASLQKIS